MASPQRADADSGSGVIWVVSADGKGARKVGGSPRARLIGWSPDGTKILAADADPLRLDNLLRAAGYDPADILVDRVVCPEDVSWNGWSIPDDSAQP